MKQKTFLWKQGMGTGVNNKWDKTDELNRELEKGWRIVGYMQPDGVMSGGGSKGRYISRAMLVILEKDDDSGLNQVQNGS